ncbi:MAG: hypothetical protein QXL17_03075 [Candidatus Thermoplasmatota archaeon]
MKSSTYASLVTILFIKHSKNVSRSIESVIRMTDQLCKKMGVENTLSHMTKYRIVSELISNHILSVRRTKKNAKVFLSKKIQTFLED